MAGEYASTHTGVISFIREMDLRKDLKVRKVDGMLPGDEHYPLRCRLRAELTRSVLSRPSGALNTGFRLPYCPDRFDEFLTCVHLSR